MIWYDKKIVKILSTYHNSNFLISKFNYEQEPIYKPESILDYNRFMGGTDLMDQSISYYKFERKTRRWTLKFAFYMIEVMINNSFLKYKIKNEKISRIEYILQAIDIFLEPEDAITETEKCLV